MEAEEAFDGPAAVQDRYLSALGAGHLGGARHLDQAVFRHIAWTVQAR